MPDRLRIERRLTYEKEHPLVVDTANALDYVSLGTTGALHGKKLPGFIEGFYRIASEVFEGTRR